MGTRSVCANSTGGLTGCADSEGACVGRTVRTLRGRARAWRASVPRGRLQLSPQRERLQTRPAPPGARGFAACLTPTLPPGPTAAPGALRRHADAGFGCWSERGPVPRAGLRTAQLAQHSWHPRGGPGARGFVPRSGDGAPRRGTQRSLVLCRHKVQLSPAKTGELTHTHTIHTPHTPTRAYPKHTPTCARNSVLSGAPPCTHTPPEAALSTPVPTHAEGSLPPSLPPRCTCTPLRGDPPHPPRVPCHPSLAGQHSTAHLETTARKPVGRDCCRSWPDPRKTHPKAPPSPGLLTVNMLERRFDCLRMGVGVLEAAMVSIRSSRWLMLGVEGTEEE